MVQQGCRSSTHRPKHGKRAETPPHASVLKHLGHGLPALRCELVCTLPTSLVGGAVERVSDSLQLRPRRVWLDVLYVLHDGLAEFIRDTRRGESSNSWMVTLGCSCDAWCVSDGVRR